MLTNTTNVNRYQIVGTPLSTYSISYPYWDKTEIVVYLTLSDGSLTTLTEGTNYTLSTPNGNNGTLTRVGDWTAGATNLTIVREMSFTQEVDLRNGDKIDAETLETALDDLTAQVQQLAESQSRAVASPVDEAGSSLTIPNKASRIGSGSGTMMGFGSDGESIALRDLAQFDTDVANTASNASSASTSAGTATTQALKSEGYAVGEQNGASVGNTSPYYHNNSKYYSQVAKAGADVITNNLSAINNLDTNMSDINDVADDITNVVAVAGDLANIDSVAGDLTNIDAVNSNKTNIDTVAGISSDVTTIAGISSDVTTVAGATTDIAAILPDIADVTAVAGDLAKVTAVADDLTNIDTVKADLTNVDTVAGSISNVNAVGGNIANVNSVAGNSTNINAVNANKTNIDTVAGKASDITTVAGKANDVSTVAGIASNVTTVAGKASDITTVAGIASDVSAVAAVDDDITAVAGELTDIGTVASNVTDISSVASDITKINAVADDLTNIDAVADDLTNIDAASSYALEAEGWANGTQGGTPVSSGSPYYENNAKYWADSVPAINDTLNQHEARIENLEEKTGDSSNVDAKSPYTIPGGKAENFLVLALDGVTRINNQQCFDTVTQYKNANGHGTWVDNVFSYNGIDATVNIDGSVTLNGTASDLFYMVVSYLLTGGTSHQYTLSGCASGGSLSTYKFGATTAGVYDTGSGNVFTIGSSQYLMIRVEGGTSVTNIKMHPTSVDLNVYFAGVIPSDANSLEKLQANYPWIFESKGYSTGTYKKTRYEVIESIGPNIFNELTEEGAIDGTTGEDTPASNFIRSIGYTRLEHGKSYYFLAPSTIRVRGYDINKNFVRTVLNGYNATVSASNLNDIYYIRFDVPGVSSYGNNIQICLDSYSDKANYHPFFKKTITLSSPVELDGVGSASEKLYLNDNGVARKTRPLGSYTFTGLESWVPYVNSLQYDGLASIIKIVSNNVFANIVSDVLVRCKAEQLYDGSVESGISVTDAGKIRVGANDVSKLTGKTILFELAIPNSDDTTTYAPVLNNYLKTKEEGVIQTSKTDPIDDGFTIGYLTL